MEQKKCTEKQAKYIKDLCRRCNAGADDKNIGSLTWKEADALIKELRSRLAMNTGEKKNEQSKVDSIRFGLSSKLVYSRFNAKNMNPLERRKAFVEEVASLYSLLKDAEKMIAQPV